MRRTPLQRRTPLAPGGRLRPVSPKRRAADRVLAANRAAAFRRDGHRCQAAAGVAAPCAGQLVAHHVTRRSQGGTHDLSNLLVLCDFHHRWVHDHPAEARALGFLN